jgi:hypothetical protein
MIVLTFTQVARKLTGYKKRKRIWVLATSKTPSISWLLLRPSVLEVTNQIQKMHYIARQVRKVKDDDQNV